MLVQGDAAGAVAHLDAGHGRCWVYRGWLLDEDDYTALYDAILDRGDRMAVTPSQLAEAAYVPNWVDVLGHETPDTVWTEDEDPDEAWDLAIDELGPPPWVIKDHLKSGRPHWHLACFVPPGADREAFREVCEALLLVRGDQFQRGFVVRRFIELATLPYTTEGRDVPDEHRIVFWQGRAVAHAPYSDVETEPLPVERFAHLGGLIDSPFFTADVARTAERGWTVIELNDGGCSSLPAQIDPWLLYRAICDEPP